MEKRKVQIGSAICHSGFHQISAPAIATPMLCTRSFDKIFHFPLSKFHFPINLTAQRVNIR